MKIIMALLLTAFVLPASIKAAESEFHASSKFSFSHNDMCGAGKSASSLAEGLNCLGVLNLYGSGTKGAWSYSYSAGAKACYDTAITSRVFKRNLKHEEKAPVCDELKKEGKAENNPHPLGQLLVRKTALNKGFSHGNALLRPAGRRFID
ncbi:MAG: hypothetical protein AUJ51_09695 [Elusimicrobia bacterium CG1_02_56_21]|nr:MAG: hypothetical protein AUJ51_09695 [Elusimicrobia bacterium CG1_02_56_21]